MLLLIDNYDSFTYNLFQYFSELGQETQVVLNDQISIPQIRALAPDYLVISPGPCTPKESGISVACVQELTLPILGVCLGHQAIASAFGGQVVAAKKLVHGKSSEIFHDGSGLFQGCPNPFSATRYHSLAVERETLPACLTVTAWTEEGEVMGIRHRERPLWGLQFHPESILTIHGKKLLRNFLEMC